MVPDFPPVGVAASPNISTANPRSRAAKRASSPSLNLDKTLTEVSRASDATPVLGVRPHASNGIQKSKKKAKPLKRGQRARQEKGLARAEAVLDQLEKKKAVSQVKVKKVRSRRALWEEINDEAIEEKRKVPRLLVGGNENRENEGAEDVGWEDEQGDAEMKTVDVGGVEVKVPLSAPLAQVVVVDRTASNAGSDLEDIT